MFRQLDVPVESVDIFMSHMQRPISGQTEFELSEARRIAESVFGPNDALTGRAYIAQAKEYLITDRSNEAAAAFARSLQMAHDDPKAPYSEPPDLDAVIGYIATLEKVGKQSEADEAKRKYSVEYMNIALRSAIVQAATAHDDKRLYQSMSELAYNYYQSGDKSRADGLFDYSIRSIEQHYGPKSEMLYTVLPTYADYLKETGRHVDWVDEMMKGFDGYAQKSEDEQRKTVAANIKSYEDERQAKIDAAKSHSNDMDGGANQTTDVISDKQGNELSREQVVANLKDAIAGGDSTSSEVKGVGDSPDRLGHPLPVPHYSVQEEQQKFNALTVIQLAIGPTSLEAASAAAELGGYISAAEPNQGQRAEAYLSYAISILSDPNLAQRPEAIPIYQTYAGFLSTHGQPDKAKEYSEKAVRLSEESVAKASALCTGPEILLPEEAAVLAGLGSFYSRTGDPKAGKAFSEGLLLLDRLNWPEHSATAVFMEKFAEFLRTSGDGKSADEWSKKAEAMRQKIALESK